MDPEVELKTLVNEQKPATGNPTANNNHSINAVGAVHVKDEITPAEVKTETAKTIEEVAAKKETESSGAADENNILKPGTKIRPIISEEEAVRFAERLYGITTKEITELKSYDDRNFLIQVDG